MKVCMPPRRHVLSWPGSRVLPRMCLPNWLGSQLHVNDGGDVVGAGLAAALLSPLARVWPGGPARVLPGGPARVLPWCGGVLGKGGLYLTDTFLHGFALHHSAKKSLVVIYKRYFTHNYPLTIAFLPPSIIMFSPFIN